MDNAQDIQPLPCVCGGQPRVMYRQPYHWVECKRKCGMHTGYYPDGFEQNDRLSRLDAIKKWNQLIAERK